MATERRFTFLRDRDGTLCRWDEDYASDVWWPDRDGKQGQWSRYQVDPFTASVTTITPERAQEIAGPDADLYAAADPKPASAVSRGGERPRDEEGGVPVAFDLGCLTAEQRELWDQNFPDLGRWTDGTICQATLLELWSFGQMCMLDDVVPSWPPELARELSVYGRQVSAYMENMRAARRRESTPG